MNAAPATGVDERVPQSEDKNTMTPKAMLKRLATFALAAALVGCGETDEPLVEYQQPGGALTGENIWPRGFHVLQSSLTITNGTLSVEACSVIQMPVGGEISVQDGGALELVGRADCPITVTSSKSVPAPGDWSYLEFYGTADSGNVLDHVIVEYGGTASYGSIWIDNGATVAIRNTTVRKSAHFGIDVVSGGNLPNFSGNTLIDNALGPITLGADEVGSLGAGTYGPNTVNAINVEYDTVTRDATWANRGVPYVLPGGFRIQTDVGSAVVTVEAGAVLRLGPAQEISVQNQGGLTLAGTAASPVTITSTKSTPAAGDWAYIEFYDGSMDGANKIEHAIIEYGGIGYGSIWVDSNASVQITDSTIRRSGHFGIEVEAGGELRDFTGNTVTENALGSVQIGANEVDDLGAGTYTGNTVDAVDIQYDTVDHTCTWLDLGVPFATAGFRIETATGAADLTLAAGVELQMKPDAGIIVSDNGSLALAGTAADPVRITSSKSSPAAGDWDEIDIYSGSTGAKNVFTYAEIEYGGGAGYGQLWVGNGAAVHLDHVTFSQGQTCDVDAESGATVNATSSPYAACP